MTAGGRRRGVRALALSDGIAGHDRITLGLLTAIARDGSLETERLSVSERRLGSRRWDRARARLMPFERFWPMCFQPTEAAAAVARARFDVVVSAGPGTAVANIALARATGARSIYFGFPKLVLAKEFDLLLRPDRPRFGLGRGAVVLRPSEIDPDLLPAARRGADRRRIALLLGGTTKRGTLTDHDFEDFAALVRTLARLGITTTISNSRRTPAAPFDRFVEALAPLRDAIEVVDYRRAGPMSNASAFTADAVVVTADSMSMIAEAIAARRPTVVARPDHYPIPRRDAAEIADHSRRNLAFEASVTELAATDWLGRLDRLSVLDVNPLDRLADLMAPVLPPRER